MQILILLKKWQNWLSECWVQSLKSFFTHRPGHKNTPDCRRQVITANLANLTWKVAACVEVIVVQKPSSRLGGRSPAVGVPRGKLVEITPPWWCLFRPLEKSSLMTAQVDKYEQRCAGVAYNSTADQLLRYVKKRSGWNLLKTIQIPANQKPNEVTKFYNYQAS